VRKSRRAFSSLTCEGHCATGAFSVKSFVGAVAFDYQPRQRRQRSSWSWLPSMSSCRRAASTAPHVNRFRLAPKTGLPSLNTTSKGRSVSSDRAQGPSCAIEKPEFPGRPDTIFYIGHAIGRHIIAAKSVFAPRRPDRRCRTFAADRPVVVHLGFVKRPAGPAPSPSVTNSRRRGQVLFYPQEVNVMLDRRVQREAVGASALISSTAPPYSWGRRQSTRHAVGAANAAPHVHRFRSAQSPACP